VPELREQLLEAQFDQREHGRHALLLLLAGPDGAAKTALGNRLCEWLDTRFIETHAFTAPGAAERGMPPLWRYWWAMPARGLTGLWYGSWYNDLLLDVTEEGLEPARLESGLRRANSLERMLSLEGVRILKIWLDSEGARARPAESEDREDRWQNGAADRTAWAPAVETMFRITSTGHAPWVTIDEDDARTRDLEVGETLLEVLGQDVSGATDEPAVASAALGRSGDPISGRFEAAERPRLDGEAYAEALAKQQKRLAKVVGSDAFAKRSLLVVFEGVDAAGKGGTVRRLAESLDPRRFRVHAYGAPNAYEQMYPYLWRFWIQLPRPGRVAVFDRSYYGRVLVERVEGLCTAAEWGRAYAEIGEFEQQMLEAGIIVQKFWLSISKDEQLRRFEERKTTPWKRHKITEEDWRNRSKWDDYERAAAEMIERTHRSEAPWHVVDSTDKKRARVDVLKLLNRRIRAALADD
jgi:polyphosphate:AMP phosphotransferase